MLPASRRMPSPWLASMDRMAPSRDCTQVGPERQDSSLLDGRDATRPALQGPLQYGAQLSAVKSKAAAPGHICFLCTPQSQRSPELTISRASTLASMASSSLPLCRTSAATSRRTCTPTQATGPGPQYSSHSAWPQGRGSSLASTFMARPPTLPCPWPCLIKCGATHRCRQRLHPPHRLLSQPPLHRRALAQRLARRAACARSNARAT